MISLKFLLLFAIVLISFSASAQPENPVLLNYEQLMNLSSSLRANYLRALRAALVEIEMDQRKDEKVSSLFSLFPQALAADETSDPCVFAGWIGTFSAPVDGHRYCHAPPDSLKGCGGGEIKCNPAIFGDVACVKRDTFATSTCDTRAASSDEIAKIYLSNAELKKRWESLAASIDQICSVTERQQAPCRRIKKRLDAVEKRENLPKPQAVEKVASGKITIDKVVHKDGSSTERPPCKTNRDQGKGSWGTCHAFCTLCALDRLAAQHNFRTSANWIVFLSSVDRVCNPGSNKASINNAQELFKATIEDGGDPKFDFAFAAHYGFCDEENYLPYSSTEPPQSPDQKGPKGLDAHQLDARNSFSDQFGIAFDDLKKLYCPNGSLNMNVADKGYAARLNAMAPQLGASGNGQKFLKCARQSLDISHKINNGGGGACTPKTGEVNGNNAAALNTIESAVHQGIPVSLEITSPKTRPVHCVTTTAFKNGEFDIINSHGEGSTVPLYSTDPIKVAGDLRGRKIMNYWYLDCGGSSVPAPPPADGEHHHHGHGDHSIH